MQFGNDSIRRYQCFVCGELSSNYEEFRQHVTTEHEEGREWVRCPLLHCQAPCRCLRTHFSAKHPQMPIPKTCQMRASVWYDQKSRGKKKKPAFAEGYYVSVKNGNKPMHYRSGYELTVYKILEVLGDVLRYYVEPIEITYFFGGKQRKYIPDLVVEYVDGRKELWEIKPANQIGIPQIKAKKAAAEAYCAQRGLTYSMITEGVIDKLKKKAKDERNG